MAMLRYGVVRLEEAAVELETETVEVTVVWHGPPGQTQL